MPEIIRNEEELKVPTDGMKIENRLLRFDDLRKTIFQWLVPLDTVDTFTTTSNTPGVILVNDAVKSTYFSMVWPRGASLARMVLVWSSASTSGSVNAFLNVETGSFGDQPNQRTTGAASFYITPDVQSLPGWPDSTNEKILANDLIYTDLTKIEDGSILGSIDFGALRPDFNGLIGIKFTRDADAQQDTLNDTMKIYGLIMEFY